MGSNIYFIDKGPSILMVDLNSLHTCEVSKDGLTRETLQRKIDEAFADQRPYFERLQPQVNPERKQSAVIITSFACNYSCEYCYQKPSKSIYDRMKPEDIDSIVRFFQVYSEKRGIPIELSDIGIMGGEPLLLENREVLEKIKQTWPQCPLAITTNGSNLLEYEDFLKSSNIEVAVSIDGTEKTHFSRRKTNDPLAYRKAIDGIRHLVEGGKKVGILTLFSPDNIDDYSLFFDEMEDLGWSHDGQSKIKLVFSPEIECGNDSRILSTVMEELEAFVALRRKDPRAWAVHAKQLLPGAASLTDALDLATKGFYTPYRCNVLSGAGFTFLPDGYVMPCIGIQNRQFSIGRFKPDIEINERIIELLAKRRVDKIEQCRACSKRVLCNGGCLATVLAKKDDPTALCCDIWEKPDYMKYFEAIVPQINSFPSQPKQAL